jgi:hypothetical protein
MLLRAVRLLVRGGRPEAPAAEGADVGLDERDDDPEAALIDIDKKKMQQSLFHVAFVFDNRDGERKPIDPLALYILTVLQNSFSIIHYQSSIWAPCFS